MKRLAAGWVFALLSGAVAAEGWDSTLVSARHAGQGLEQLALRVEQVAEFVDEEIVE